MRLCAGVSGDGLGGLGRTSQTGRGLSTLLLEEPGRISPPKPQASFGFGGSWLEQSRLELGSEQTVTGLAWIRRCFHKCPGLVCFLLPHSMALGCES